MALRPFWPRPHPSPGLIALGVVNLAYGLVGIFSLPFIVVQKWAPMSADNPAVGLYDDPVAGTTFLALGIMGVPLNVSMGVAGIGLLRRRGWGRRLSLIWAAIQIPLTIVTTLLMVVYLLPRIEASMPQQSPMMVPGFRAIYVLSSGFGLVVALVYPILLLVLLNRDRFRLQFDPPWDAVPPAWPPEAWMGIPPSARATAAAACGIAGVALDVICCCMHGYVAGIACGTLAFLYGTLGHRDILGGIAPTAGRERAALGRICGLIALGLGIVIGIVMAAWMVFALFASRFSWLR